MEKKAVAFAAARAALQGVSPDFADKLKSLDEALAAEENRHRLAVRNFKASRKTWEHIKSRLSRRRGG